MARATIRGPLFVTIVRQIMATIAKMLWSANLSHDRLKPGLNCRILDKAGNDELGQRHRTDGDYKLRSDGLEENAANEPCIRIGVPLYRRPDRQAIGIVPNRRVTCLPFPRASPVDMPSNSPLDR